MQPLDRKAGTDPWHERLKPTAARGKLQAADRRQGSGTIPGADESRHIPTRSQVCMGVPRAAEGVEGREQIHMVRSRRHDQKQMDRRLRRDRRRLGRFAAFAEMEADLRPILLFDHPSSEAHEAAPPQVSDSGSAPEEV